MFNYLKEGKKREWNDVNKSENQKANVDWKVKLPKLTHTTQTYGQNSKLRASLLGSSMNNRENYYAPAVREVSGVTESKGEIILIEKAEKRGEQKEKYNQIAMKLGEGKCKEKRDSWEKDAYVQLKCKEQKLQGKGWELMESRGTRGFLDSQLA